MDIRNPLFKHIAAIVAGIMFVNPVAVLGAELALDAGAGGNTSLGQAGNGVPVVNIATPSGAGLSHNRFDGYNVGQQGLILNNATGATNSTQLGGLILGNPNLSGGAAGLILNEVTGANPSNLRGYTEVAGQRAGVIVANPHGITCDGCGFINTPRVTLSTGKPVVEQGALRQFDVEGGAISIQGAGLNATNIDQFDIITRSAQINAELHANQLNIVTGRNVVDAGTLNATAKAGDAADKPQFAVDSSALGGMYTGAIRLIGTEQGVGVRLAGDLAAHAGDIQIDASGQLSMGRVAAAGDLQVKAQGIELTRDTYAAGNAQLAATQQLLNRDALAAGSQVNLHASELNNQGLIEAGVRPDNSRNPDADLRVQADRVINAGTIATSRELTVTATDSLDNRGGTLAADETRLNAQRLDNQQGRVLAERQLDLQTGQLDNRQGLLQSRGASNLAVTGTLDNRAGDVISGGTLNLSVGTLDNNEQGLVAGLGEANINATLVDNRNGTINAREQLNIKADALKNQSGVLATDAKLLLDAVALDNRGGEISGGESVTLQSGKLDNSAGGKIITGGTLDVTASALDNSKAGLLSGWQGVNVTAEDLSNREGGTISSGEGALTLDVSGSLDNSADGALVSHGTQNIHAGDLNNAAGFISGQTDVTLVVGDRLNSDAGVLASGGSLDVTAGQLSNQAGYIGSTGPLLVTADSLDNRGGQMAGAGTLTLALTGALLNQSGQLTSSGPLRVQAGIIDNRNGYLASQALLELFGIDLLNGNGGTLAAGTGLKIDMTGQLHNSQGGSMFTQAGPLDIRAGDLNNDSGAIQGRNVALHIGSTLSNQRGDLVALDSILLQAQSLDNRHGRLGAADISIATAGLLNNSSGLIEAGSKLALNVGSLDNRAGSLRSLGYLGTTTVLSRGLLDNRNGTIESASHDLWFQLPSLMNQGGVIRHVGSGSLELASARLIEGGGSFITHGDLTINSASWAHDGLVQAARLTLNVGQLHQTEQGRLLAGEVFTGTGHNWTNQGLIASDGWLDLALGGQYSSGGVLSGLGDTLLGAASLSLGNTGRIAGGGDLGLIINHTLTNQGRITAHGDLLASAGTLTNRGTLGAAGNLYVNAGQLRNEHALLLSGNDMSLHVDQLTNRYADVYSLGSLDIGQSGQRRSALVENISATIEAAGHLWMRAVNFVNRKDVFAIQDEQTAGEMTVVCYDCKGDHHYVDYIVTERFQGRIVADSPSSLLQSGGSMDLNLSNLDNLQSTIAAAGNLYITADRLNNVGAATAETTRVRTWHSGRITDGTDDRFRRGYLYPYNDAPLPKLVPEAYMNQNFTLNDDVTTVVVNGQTAPAIIQAGGLVHVNVAGQLNNDVVVHQGVAAGIARGASTSVSGTVPVVVTLNPQLPPDLAQQVVNPIALPGFTLPQGENGLFRLSGQTGSGSVEGTPTSQPVSQASATRPNAPSAGGHRYLIETNPALTDLRQFMSSDYMLGQLGFDPDAAQKRLGDGLYEQRLVREAIIARTGQRYLAGLTNDEDMFRYLMDNAIASKDALGLALGVSLAAEQVAALTHDIVWMEEHEVMGERVLVSVLYLAQAEGRLTANGALIQGRDLELISGGDLRNQGTLRASDSLTARAENITNSGLMQAHERVQLIAMDSIRNTLGGVIAGRDVVLTAVNGDIINERSVTHYQNQGERWAQSGTLLDSAARIEASGNLSLNAGRDLINSGGALQAGGDATLQAGNNLSITAVEQRSGAMRQERRSYSESSQVTQHGSEVTIGGNLSAASGNDLAIIASRVEAGGDMRLAAGNDVLIASAANEEHNESRYRGSSRRVTRESSSVQQQGAELIAGGDLMIAAGEDLIGIASRIESGGQAYLVAGGNIAMFAGENLEHSLSEKSKKGSFGRKSSRSDQVTRVTQQGMQIQSAGDLAIVSGGDQLYQAAELRSGNDLTLDAGGAITFEAVKDLHQESHEKSKSDWAWTSAKGKGTTDETLIQSQLIAQGNLAIRAAEGIQIDIKEIDQHTVSQTIDAMVQADPDLAWLKQMEAQGDIDWRTVKEIHDSFEYSHSGLGVGAQLVIAIAVSAIVGPAASGLAGGGGLGAAAGAAASGAATNTSVSFINNRGDLGAVFKDVTSSDALKDYATAALTAGVTTGYLDQAFGVETDFVNHTTKGFEIGTVGGAAQFGSHLAAQGAIQATSQTLTNGGSFSNNLEAAFTAQIYHLAQAVAFNAVGDFAKANNFAEGGLEKTALHALTGGLISKAMGQDFATGALAAGANEALIEQLSQYVQLNDGLQQAASQIVGAVAAGITGGDVNHAANLAKNATAYNRQLHPSERELAKRLAELSGGKFTAEEIEQQMRLAGIEGTDIHAGTDIVSLTEERYDLGGNWRPSGDNHMVQDFGEPNPEIIAYIREHAHFYSWAEGIETGFFRANPSDWTAASSNVQRDRLTGYAIDDNGGYRIPMAVDGVVHAPRFHPCSDALCLASGANIDFSDPATLRWIRSVNAKTAEQVSFSLAVAAVGSPAAATGALAWGSTGVGILAGFLNESTEKALSAAAVSTAFHSYATSKGLSPAQATRLASAVEAADGWSRLVDTVWIGE